MPIKAVINKIKAPKGRCVKSVFADFILELLRKNRRSHGLSSIRANTLDVPVFGHADVKTLEKKVLFHKAFLKRSHQ
jgi:hypothetical protein